jgi:hypothetical protein
MIANNVLAHAADTNGFVEGFRTLLNDDGVAVFEFPYVRDLLDHCEFDTIYHEHLCYFSVGSVDRLFRRHGLFINDVKRLSIHGGSLRIYAGVRENVQESVKELLAEEAALGIDKHQYYRAFRANVERIRDTLHSLLEDLRLQGKRIAGYGAAAKGTIMLNYLGVDRGTIEFLVDRNTHKQGKWMPGVRIPIFDPAELVARMPDYTVILPWNFKEEIIRQQADYRARGGKFVIPIPEPTVV